MPRDILFFSSCYLLTLLLTLTFHLHLSSLWDTIRKSYLARAAEPDHGILKLMGLKVMQKRCSNKKQLLFRSKWIVLLCVLSYRAVFFAVLLSEGDSIHTLQCSFFLFVDEDNGSRPQGQILTLLITSLLECRINCRIDVLVVSSKFRLATGESSLSSTFSTFICICIFAFSSLTLLVGPQEEHPACKNEWWGVGVVICLKRGADCLHTVQLMPLHPKTPSSLASFKSRLVLPFWYWLTQVVLEKRPLNGCSSILT